jgi:hypothetical protein
MSQRFAVLSLGLSLLVFSSLCFEIAETVSYSRAAALADLDGDGDLDAFLANGRSEPAEPNTVWLNDGRGRFHDSGQRLDERNSYSAATSDLDGDGDLDVLVGNATSCAVHENNGRGRFTTGQRLGTPGDSGAFRWFAATGDLDGDGDLDAFGAGCCGAYRTWGSGTKVALQPYNVVWLNDGTGHLQDSGQRLGVLGSYAVALGDVDGDADLDAWVGNDGPDKVWLNDGSGQFVDSGQQLGNAKGHAAALGDVDGDGDLDALVGNDGPNAVWLNDGSGRYADSGQALGRARTQVVSLADLDRDGDVDAFMGDRLGVRIWMNNGAGYFRSSQQTMPHLPLYAATLGDVDGDGDLDVVAGHVGRRTQVWLNDGTGRLGQISPWWNRCGWLTVGACAIALGGLSGWAIRRGRSRGAGSSR